MQSVSDRWYVLYSRIVTLIAVILLAACVVAWTVPEYASLKSTWGFTYITCSLALLQLLYTLLFYKRETQESGRFSATLFLSLFQVLIVINLIQSTGEFSSVYMAYWAVLVLASGMFGLYAVVGYAFVMSLYFVLTTANSITTEPFNPSDAIILFATYMIGVIGYLFWRKHYINSEAVKVAELSGMLKSKQQQSEILIQSIADGIIVTDTEGKINLINPAASKITEWDVGEAVGIDISLVLKLHKEDGEELPDEANPFKIVLDGKNPTSQVLGITGRSGSKRMISLVISPVLMPGGKDIVGTVAVIRDISDSHAEEKRRADFISTASHEMRTPVAAIEGYLALALNEHVSKIDSKAREYLEKAHSSTQSLGKLFQDLLTSAKAEDGRLVSHPTVVEMGEFLEQLTDSFQFSAEKKGLLTEFIVGTSSKSDAGNNKVVKPLYYVHIDADRMREVITNLFDNAVKYTPSGKISLGLTGNNDVVQLYIKDTGIGIPKEDVPHMFQKFYRVDNSSTRTIGGTGLGLFISRKIVELYNGRIWVESEFNKGSTFYINLPRLSTQKATELQKQETANSPVATSVLKSS
jgi:PAS domain S-box-containing protein